ncbi:hypothetical protein B0H19DRAFT_1088537 [Mycena capillaripes]|nr:hypothetical protein B0H19DRAFT_1088537 [Mycena capillaripes]
MAFSLQTSAAAPRESPLPQPPRHMKEAGHVPLLETWAKNSSCKNFTVELKLH